MAYVAISGELRDSIRRNIQAMCRRELQAAPPTEKTEIVQSHQITDHHYQLSWGEFVHLKDQMPKEWMRYTESLQLKADRCIDDEGRTVSAFIQLTFPGKIASPPGTEHWGRRVSVSEDYPGMKEMLDAAHQRLEINARWDKILNDVAKFIANCKSLNEALKLWPALRAYIPQNYLDRIDQKVAKVKDSAALEVLKQIDTESATAAVVGLRFIEAAQGKP